MAAKGPIAYLIGKSVLELSGILLGAFLGVLLGKMLMVPRLATLSVLLLTVPLGIASIVLILHRSSRKKYRRFGDIIVRFAHWFFAGVGGAFAALLISTGPGLYEVSPTLGVLAAMVFVAVMFLVVLTLNILTS